MNEYVTKCDNAREIGNLRGKRRIGTPQPAKSFANDFKLPLHARPQEFIGEVIVEAVARRKAGNPFGGAHCVPKILRSVRRDYSHGTGNKGRRSLSIRRRKYGFCSAASVTRSTGRPESASKASCSPK